MDKSNRKRFDVGSSGVTVYEARILPVEKLKGKFAVGENEMHEEEWINEHYIKERLKALGVVE